MPSRLISQTVWHVTVAEANHLLRIDSPDDDADIQSMIEAATQLATTYTRRAIAISSMRLTLDAFPAEIELLFPPVLSVASISYIDVDGVTQIVASNQYVLDAASEPCWVLPADSVTWPQTKVTANAVQVDYSAGYGTACPSAIKQFILLHVGDMYKNREATVDAKSGLVQTGERLLDPWVIPN